VSEERYNNLRKVIGTLKSRRAGAPPENAKIMLFIMGGAMRGIWSIAQLKALLEYGYSFDVVVGNSVGAPVAAYYLAGERNFEAGLNFFFDEVPKRIKPLRFWKIIDIEGIIDALRQGECALDLKAVKRNPAQFFAEVADSAKKYHLLDVKEYGIDALKAAISIRILGGKPVGVAGAEYVDGGAYHQLPLGDLIKRFKPTDILILPNVREKEMNTPGINQMISALKEMLGGKKSSWETRKAIELNMRKNALCASRLYRPEVNTAVLYPPETTKVSLLETKRSTLLKAYEQTLHETRKVLQLNE